MKNMNLNNGYLLTIETDGDLGISGKGLGENKEHQRLIIEADSVEDARISILGVLQGIIITPRNGGESHFEDFKEKLAEAIERVESGNLDMCNGGNRGISIERL